jgi:hypothetical protein
MKIILSHDIDHLYWKEHYFNDLFLPGVVYRNTIGYLTRNLNFGIYKKRLYCFGRIHKIPELIKFYNGNNIKANFFFGMDNALHLSYKYKKAKPLVRELIKNGHKVSVHGIAFKNSVHINNEYQRFKTISGIDSFGIRTHYLRLSGFSHHLFDEQGYLFDSSIDCIMQPFKINRMWEIPISIMDASLVENAQLNQDLSIWKQNTLKRLEKAIEIKLPYFVINFHDLYFSELFPVIKEWYLWLVDFLQEKKYEFITFEQAVIELNKKEKDKIK